MSVFIAIVAFLIILVVAILIHELGHYITAKISGVRVEEFGLGLPPRIWGYKKGETIYSINWIPLGGFCRMAGEEDPDVPQSLAGKSIKTRLLVLSAGSVFMLLFPLFLFPAAYMTPMDRPVEDAGVAVTKVFEGSPAETAGIEADDIILSIDEQEVTYESIGDIIDASAGTEISIALLRGDSQLDVTATPRTEEETPEGQKALGIQMDYVKETIAYPPWEAIPKGVGEYSQIYIGIKTAFTSLASGEVSWKDAVVGPVGIAHLTKEASVGGIEHLVWLGAIICVVLGIVNLLPIPGLDGGRLVFVVIEGIRRGKRISPQKEGMVHLVGFALLLGLVVAVTYNDVVRLISGGEFLR